MNKHIFVEDILNNMIIRKASCIIGSSYGLHQTNGQAVER